MIAGLTDIVKRYKSTTALDHFSLTVNKGEVLGLLGPNGAGKSTAIRVLCRLADADNGTVSLFGSPAKGQALAQKKRIGLVPQDVALYEALPARENLLYFGRLYGVPAKRCKGRAEEILELLGLHDVAKKAPKTFSGGMKRRLNIGCALMHEPELLILDEPTVGVDPQSRNHILEFVERSAKEGVTVIYTSHYMDEVERVASRVVIMDAGHTIADGTPEELTRQLLFEDTLTVELKTPAPALTEGVKAVQGVRQVRLEGRCLTITSDAKAYNLSRVMELCMPSGVLSIRSKKPTLEDVFLSLTGKSLRDGDEG